MIKTKNNKEKYLNVFFLTILAGVICFLPICLINHGNFLLYADYNKQQIMFYTHMHDMVNAGMSQWDWNVDLGSDTVASYSFYLLGSPFFWLSTLFPSKIIVTLMPFLLTLKCGVASVGAYGYSRRFCKNTTACAVAGILYGLSSYGTANMLYNHFHEAICILPFLLWSFEALMQDNRKGFFALTVGLSAIMNYYFFFGQVIFVCIYFVVGLITGHFKITLKKFMTLFFESVLGVAISAVLLLPSAMAVANNPRVTSFLSGSGWVIYSWKSIYFYILQNMFMPNNIPMIKNFGMLRADALDSTSYASYIPFFSLCGVIAYFRTVKGKDFFKMMLTVCLVFIFIPALNQIFSMFNQMFYGRWFYMPLLIATVTTAKALEMWQEGKLDLKKGFVPTAVITGIVITSSFIVMILSEMKKINVEFEDYTYPKIRIAFTIFAFIFLWLVIYKPESADTKIMMKKIFTRATIFTICGMCIPLWYAYTTRGSSESEYMNSSIDYSGRSDKIEKTGFFRMSSSINLVNMPVVWGYPTVRYFNSTVEPTIMEFYDSIGINRSVKSDVDITNYPLMSMLSVKYYVDEPYYDANGNVKEPAETLDGSRNTYKVMYQKNDLNFYENTEYIPMGFTFDYYTTKEDIADLPVLVKSSTVLDALILDDEQVQKYGNILKRYDVSKANTITQNYHEICENRRNNSCYYFKENGDEFEGKIKLDKENLVFFSVPYSENWSAKVNGKPVQIEKVDGGLMAVKCDAGDNDITFEYNNKYLAYGKYITFSAIIVFAGYVIINVITSKKKNDNKQS